MESPSDKFSPGFSAAVSLAFRDALGACLFSVGDVLYDTKDGYLPWKVGVTKLSWGIQVIQSSTKSSQSSEDTPEEEEGEDSADTFGSLLFERNWRAPITIRLTDYRTKQAVELVSTQGKLYTALWKGEPKVLSEKSDPLIPITVAKAGKLFNEQAKALMGPDTPTTTTWIMAYDSTNPVTTRKLAGIRNCLAEYELEAYETRIPGSDISLELAPTVEFLKLSVETKKVETFRDAIIKALWPQRTAPLKKTVLSVFENSKRKPLRFSLDRHGLFYPKPRGLYDGKDIWIRCFSHVTNYRYRLHRPKTLGAPKALSNFLESIFDSTPNFLFSRSIHASALAADNPPKALPLQNHPLVALASLSDAVKLAKQRHESLQMYLIEHCEKTFACEIPLWVEASEFKDYAEVFNSTLPLTGHVDFLRFEEDGRIGIWDYKPGAAYETKAFHQLSLYAFMLATRTGMPASAFICGYFDEVYAFSFKPEEHPLVGRAA